jgi:endonuclease/exonuclease/phosphatase family metal-dependent hydrolase
MSIKIASWNVEGRLSGYAEHGRGSAEQIINGIAELDADVVVLPEGYLEEPAVGVDDRLSDLGYEWHDVGYGDKDRDWSQEYLGKMTYLRVLSRIAIKDAQQVLWGDLRSLLTFTAADPETQAEARFFAIHLDDRNEALRLRQIEDIIPAVNEEPLPAVLLGDFNAMWPKGRAQLFGSKVMRFVAEHFPQPGIRHTLTRLAEMATGSALTRLAEEAGLRDADPRHRATTTPKMRDTPFMPSVRLAQIDHILVSGGIGVENYVVGKDRGSDHRAISADITIQSKG